ncbi:uncharacterized protein METZ01_LOCUS185705, partial [marine metagenome]
VRRPRRHWTATSPCVPTSKPVTTTAASSSPTLHWRIPSLKDWSRRAGNLMN